MKRIFISTLLIVLSISAFAYAQYTVYTWGYQDIMVSMLEAVKYFMGTKSFGDMFKIAMLLSMITVFLSLISDKGFSPVLIFQKVILVIALQTFLISPFSQMNLDVVDVSGNGALTPNGVAERVEKVPGVVGYPLYVLSNLEYGVREAFRASLNFGGLRAGAQYLDGMSIITALNLYQSTTNVRINNPDFTRSYQSFVENCVLPDMVSGYLDVRAVATSTNLWQLFGQDLHKARIGSFYMDYSQEWGPDGKILTCDKLYHAIDNQFATVSAAAANQLKAGLGLSAGIQLDRMIGAVNTAIVGFQQNQSNVLTNSMAINTFNDSYENIANGMGLDTTGLAYSMAKAQETARMNASMQGIMAKKYMPIAKGYLTVIFVAVIPLIIIIALVTSNFQKPFAMIFGLLIALALWNVGDQLLDFIIIVRTKALFALSGMNGYNMESQPFINSVITDTLSLSLGMYWMIPTLAFSIATLSGYGAASMMGSIAGTATAGVSSATAEAASGSMSVGNIRMNNVNMNKYDAAQTMNAGTSSKLSMDHQQTASNQSSVRTGTEISNKDIDENVHKGSTWITDSQTGKTYEVNGTFDQTSGGWTGSGTINEYDKNGNFVGSYKGEISGTGNMSDYQKDVVQGGQGGRENAFQASSVVSTNLDASNVKTENTKYENMDTVNVGNSGSMSGDNIMVNGESVSGKVSWNGDTATIEGTKDGMKYTATVENASIGFGKNGMSVTGDIVKSNSEGGNSTNINNATTISGGTKLALGDEVNGYTGGLEIVNQGLSKFGANEGLMKEAFVDNMTKYQDSILQRGGKDQISEQQALDAMGKFEASAGFKALGNGASIGFNAALKASVDHSSGQVDTANLNRLMNENIMNQLDADAKANNWTAEQYDKAAQERFRAYNDFLKNELGGQVYGPGNAMNEALDGAKNMFGSAANAAGKAADKIDEMGEKHMNKVLK